jgi:hypothetical protein
MVGHPGVSDEDGTMGTWPIGGAHNHPMRLPVADLTSGPGISHDLDSDLLILAGAHRFCNESRSWERARYEMSEHSPGGPFPFVFLFSGFQFHAFKCLLR